MIKINLSDLNIVVTGASRGIGHSIASHLGKAGASLAIHYNKNKEPAESLANEIGPNSRIYQANLENKDECVQLFEKIERDFKRIDVLVNNAGIAIKSPVDLPSGEWISRWEETLRVNLTATAILCKSAINHFLNQNGGRIINIASRAAFRGDTIDYMAYAASKGGVVSLTRSIARGFGKQNIKAFVVAPGYVRTDMSQGFIDEYGEEIATHDTALLHMTEPNDVAPLVTFIASGMADHATGSTFDINAGSYFH